MSVIDPASKPVKGLDLKELFLSGYSSKKDEEEDKFVKELNQSLDAQNQVSATQKNAETMGNHVNSPAQELELMRSRNNAVYLPAYMVEARGTGAIIHRDG